MKNGMIILSHIVLSLCIIGNDGNDKPMSIINNTLGLFNNFHAILEHCFSMRSFKETVSCERGLAGLLKLLDGQTPLWTMLSFIIGCP